MVGEMSRDKEEGKKGMTKEERKRLAVGYERRKKRSRNEERQRNEEEEKREKERSW